MKKMLLCIIILCMYGFPVLSDTIILKTGEKLSGKVLRITDRTVEYDPDGDIPFDAVDKKNVETVIRSGEQPVHMSILDNEAILPGKKTGEEKDPKIHIPFDLDLYPTLELGGYADPAFTRWAHRRIDQYFNYLKSQGSLYEDYTLEHRNQGQAKSKDQQTASYGGTGLGIAGDLFCKNFGFGVWYHGITDSSNPVLDSIVKDKEGGMLCRITFKSDYDTWSFSFYYRIVLNPAVWGISPAATVKTYIRLGAGPDIAYSNYNFDIELLHSAANDMFQNQFVVDCKVKRYGVHANASWCLESGLLSCSLGMYYSYMFKSHAVITGNSPGLGKNSIGAAQAFSLIGGIGLHF